MSKDKGPQEVSFGPTGPFQIWDAKHSKISSDLI